MRTLFTAALTLMLVLGAAAVASADFCLHEPSTDSVVVGKGFTLPAQGVCKDFRGFLQGTTEGWFGQACGSSDGDRITFYLTVVNTQLDALFSSSISLDRGTLTGPGKLCFASSSGTGCGAFNFARIACSPPKVPVP